MAALRRNFPFALAGSLLTVGLIVVVLHGIFALRELLGWLAANALATLTRGGLVARYERTHRQMASLRRWERSMRWCTALAGSLWGVPYAYWLFTRPSNIRCS
ncbi:hypothetical protein [Paraburkholderia xenovorans]|uniref:hypothetical protein n=1 Tax=Paraburkholderia xenovorans TaxID=36873 RepID=UPI0038B6CA44